MHFFDQKRNSAGMGPVIHTHIPTMQYIMPTVLTNLCPVEASQCNEQVFEIERHISPNVFCIIVGAVAAKQAVEETIASKCRSRWCVVSKVCIDCVQA